MDFPELRMRRVHLSNSENIEDINSGREGHGMEQSRGCRSKDEWAGHQLGLVHLSCPSPLPPCAPLHHHRSPALPKLYWRSWGNWKDINAAPLCMCAYLIFVICFTRAKFLENKIYTEKTHKLRQNTQKIANFLHYYGKIHSKLPIFRV